VLTTKSTLHRFLILGITSLLVSCGGGSSSGGGLPTEDTSAPKVVSTVPTNPASNVSTASQISVTFSKAITDNFDETSFLVIPYKGTQVSTISIANQGINYDSGTKTVTFIPQDSLVTNTKYQVALRDIRHTNGSLLIAEYTWDFETEGPPTVLSVLPKSTGFVEQKPNIKIVFSEAMLLSSLSSNILLDGIGLAG